ncbi:hypothetical protein DPSP01_006637 [Paraphaeosphaeria sporulosa]
MYTKLYLLASSIIVGLAQARAVQNGGLTSREECRSGEAGGFFINTVEPGQGPWYPEVNSNRTYTASEASGESTCLKMDTILNDLAGSQKKSQRITNISPIAGGYCQLYESNDCTGEAMKLPNPKNWELKYPE